MTMKKLLTSLIICLGLTGCADTIRDDIYFAIKDSENDDAADESLPDESYLETPWTW